MSVEGLSINGVAHKYVYDALEETPDIESYVTDLANGEDVYKTTHFDKCVMGDVHSVGFDIYNPTPSTNTAYYPEYFDNTFKVYFDDSIYKVNIAGYDENKAYTNKVNPVTTSPATVKSLSTAGLIDCPWFAIEVRNKDNSTLDLATVNVAGIYVETLVIENKNNAFLSILSNEITGAKLTGVNLLDNPSGLNQNGVTPTANGFDVAAGGYYFAVVQLEKLEDTAYYCFTCESEIPIKWAWYSSSGGAISSHHDVNRRGRLYYAEVKKAEAPSNATGIQLRLDNRTGSETLSFSKVILANGAYTSAVNPDKIAYVSASGSDENDGATRSTAYATIQKAIDSGAKKIIVKSGTYGEGFTMQNMNGVSIELDRYYDSFSPGSSEENPKIVVDTTASTGVTITNCYDCNFDSIEVKNCASQGWRIDKCSGLVFRDCLADNIGIGATSGGGFVITHTNADYYNCGAYNIGTTTASTNPAYHLDGFNIHETGTTNFINCWAYNCLDDGISHHDACYGYIDGGEWYGCGKGGIASPTHGAHVDVRNIYSHDNGFGIYAQTDHGVQSLRSAINITNCVCKNNRTKDISIEDTYYTANVWNCVYDTSEGFTELT